MASATPPPGLPWHPLRQTLAWIRHPEATLDRCVRDYGDAFSLRMFGTQFTLFSSPALIKEMLAQPPSVLAAGKANALLIPIVGNASVMVLDGDDHLSMRRMQLPPFHGDRMRSYEHAMRDIAEAAIARWPIEDPFQTWTRMQAITLDIIVRVVFGIEDSRRADAVKAAIRKLLDEGTNPRLMVSAAIQSVLLKRPQKPEARALRRVNAARHDLARLLDAEISRRRDEPEEDRGDVLSLLLAARDEQGQGLPTPILRDQLVTLLAAGHETTATALSWAVERIARHPELQDRLAAEALDGKHELIDATVREVLRARPVLPIFLREVQEPVEIGGFQFEPGTLVGGATMALHRRPDLYPDPGAFRPERFIGDAAPGTYEWTPFGGGVRRCLGASFAMLEMRIVLSALLAERCLTPVGDDRAESVRRRSIVLAPSAGGQVRAPRRRSARPAPTDPTHTEVR